MKYSKLEKIGVELSKLGFGAMRFPTDENGVINQEAVNEMIDLAMENGVNYYDTSIVYHDGYSEVALGKALSKFNRNDFYIADKMSFWGVERAEQLDEIFNGSLERLGMDYIDFYLMHSLSTPIVDKMIKVNAIEWALEKKKQGKIKYLGFSIHDDLNLLLRVLNEYEGWDFAQIQYNYLDEIGLPGTAGYNELVKRNIPIIIMEPLKGGFLASMPGNIEEPFKKLGGSNASYSFRWLAEKPGIVTILSGMNNIEHAKENIKTFSNIQPLNEEERAAVEDVKERILASQKVPCTGCRYCMPCPLKIDIPGIFSAWNLKSMNKTGNWISGTDINYGQAEACVSCKKCMTKCPQQIQIPEKFQELLNSR